MCIVEIVLIIFLLLFYKRIFNKKINYMFVFNLIWLLLIFCSRFGFYGIKPPSTKTYVYIYVMLITFNIFSLFFLKVKISNNKHTKYIKKNNNPEITKDFSICLIAISLFAFIVLIAKVPFAINLLRRGGFNAIRSNFLNADTENFTGGVFVTGFINAIIVATFYISFFYIINNPTKKGKKYAIITLTIDIFNLLLYMLITGGRFLFVICFGSICLGIFLHSNGRITKIFMKYKKIVVLITIAIIVLLYISSQRTLSGLNLFGNVYVYFFGTINLLDSLLKSEASYNLMGGTLLIGGLITPIILFLNKYCGTNFYLALAELNKTTSQFVWISKNIHMNNNCTFIYGAVRDFGFLGIIVYTIIWAYFLAHYYKKYTIQKQAVNEAKYVYVLIISIFLLFEWMPARTSIVYSLIFMSIFEKLNRNQIKQK